MKNMTKTFYGYTPQDYVYINSYTSRDKTFETRRFPVGSRGSVAVKIESGNIIYGVSICDEQDTFSKEFGRQLAESRMHGGYGTVPLHHFTAGLKEALTPEEIALKFLGSLLGSVYDNPAKYKEKIKDYKDKHKPGKKA